jgi:hypothetical protein
MRCRGWIHTVALFSSFRWDPRASYYPKAPASGSSEASIAGASEASISSGGDPMVAPAAPSLLEVCRRVRSIEISICPMILKWLSNFQIDATGGPDFTRVSVSQLPVILPGFC